MTGGMAILLHFTCMAGLRPFLRARREVWVLGGHLLPAGGLYWQQHHHPDCGWPVTEGATLIHRSSLRPNESTRINTPFNSEPAHVPWIPACMRHVYLHLNHTLTSCNRRGSALADWAAASHDLGIGILIKKSQQTVCWATGHLQAVPPGLHSSRWHTAGALRDHAAGLDCYFWRRPAHHLAAPGHLLPARAQPRLHLLHCALRHWLPGHVHLQW